MGNKTRPPDSSASVSSGFESTFVPNPMREDGRTALLEVAEHVGKASRAAGSGAWVVFIAAIGHHDEHAPPLRVGESSQRLGQRVVQRGAAHGGVRVNRLAREFPVERQVVREIRAVGEVDDRQGVVRAKRPYELAGGGDDVGFALAHAAAVVEGQDDRDGLRGFLEHVHALRDAVLDDFQILGGHLEVLALRDRPR